QQRDAREGDRRRSFSHGLSIREAGGRREVRPNPVRGERPTARLGPLLPGLMVRRAVSAPENPSYNSPVTRAEELRRTASHRISPELLLLGLNLAVSVPLAYALNLWQDEAYTLHTTGAGVPYAFSAAIGFEQNAPLYFVIVALLRHFGSGLFFLRLFSVLCIAATVALVPLLSRRYLPKIDPNWVTAVVALNPFVIYAAVDLRAYGLIVLLSALLLLTCYDAFLAESPSKGAAVAFALCVAAAL